MQCADELTASVARIAHCCAHGISQNGSGHRLEVRSVSVRRARARPAPSSVGVFFFRGGILFRNPFLDSRIFFFSFSLFACMRPGGPLRGLRRHPCGSRVPCRAAASLTPRAPSRCITRRAHRKSRHAALARSAVSSAVSLVTVHPRTLVSLVSFRSASPR